MRELDSLVCRVQRPITTKYLDTPAAVNAIQSQLFVRVVSVATAV